MYLQQCRASKAQSPLQPPSEFRNKVSFCVFLITDTKAVISFAACFIATGLASAPFQSLIEIEQSLYR
jgi:hypothetical protein